jgi:hypothetical protein
MRGRRDWMIAIVAAASTIAGAVIGGGASYIATREANRSAERREARQVHATTRAAARLVYSELGEAEGYLGQLRRREISWPRHEAAIRAALPRASWIAHRATLARAVAVDDWLLLDQAYVALHRAAPSFARLPKLALRRKLLEVLSQLVSRAQSELLPYLE